MDSKRTEYLKNHFAVTLFIKETGHCLTLPDVTIASACALYHRFMAVIDDHNDFDLNMIGNFKSPGEMILIDGCAQLKNAEPHIRKKMVGSTALYLAGKAEETPCKLRDLINMSYNILNKNKPLIEIAKKYWDLRESIVKSELLFLRLLGFQVTVDNPHKYMLHYLKSLEDWCDDRSWQLSQLPQTCWSVLNDTFHTTLCLEESASRIAVAVIYFAVSCTGLKVPSETAQRQWWQVFCPDITKEDVHKIVNRIMDLYDFETEKILRVP